MKRLELLQQTETQKATVELQYQLEKDRLQLEADLLETRSALELKRQELHRRKSDRELSPVKVIEVQGEIEALERGVKALEALKKELF